MKRFMSCLLLGLTFTMISCNDPYPNTVNEGKDVSQRDSNRKAHLPDQDEIAEVTVRVVQSSIGKEPTEEFRVPKALFGEIIDKLSSATQDPDPAKWEGFGWVKITDRNAAETDLSLYLATGAGAETELQYRINGGDEYWRAGLASDFERLVRRAKAESSTRE